MAEQATSDEVVFDIAALASAWSPEAIAAFSEGFCPDCRMELVKSWAICPACNTGWWLLRKDDPSSLVGVRSRRKENADG